MRITYNDKLNKLLNPYLESLLKEKSSLEPETLTLFDLFMEDLDMGGRYGIFSEILEPRLEEIIREENIESIANLMDGRLNTLFRYMLGDEFAGLFHTYLQLEARCPHTIGYDRRAQRSAHPSNHLDHARDAWLQFLKLRATGFSVEAILKGGNTPEDTEEFSGYMNSSYWLAAQIAQGNEKVIEYLNQVLTSENNVHRLQRWYLHAIAISGHRPLLELEGKLLLAAKHCAKPSWKRWTKDVPKVTSTCSPSSTTTDCNVLPPSSEASPYAPESANRTAANGLPTSMSN
jgi:hypothetical protein